MNKAAPTGWLADQVDLDVLTRLVKRAWTAAQWIDALGKYRDNLYQRYKDIQIFGQPEPVPLEGLFTHVRLLDKPTAFQRYDVRALQEAIAEDPDALRRVLHSGTREEVEVIEGRELFTRPEAHRLLILGKPGAGKTTFLQHLTLETTKGRLDKLPILVTLREWREVGDYEDLLGFIARQFDICQFPEARPIVEYFLRHIDTLVLFDGLDEIPEEGDRRGQAIDALRDFARKYPRSQILITCRVAATDYAFRGFKYVELADFNEGQMHAFVRKWFRDEEDLAERFWEEYQREENEGLRELGQVPLLLALLCLGYEERLAFPRQRVDLYEEALDALLKKWDSSRRIRRDEIYEKLSVGRKHQMLAQLAAQYFQDGRYFFDQRDVADRIAAYLRKLPPAAPDEEIDGEAVLKAIEAQHGVLVERARHVHAFAHLTFQEYYTAKYVVDHARHGTLKILLNEHATEDRWHEVILLTASLLPEANDFPEYFLKILDDLVREEEKLVKLLAWAKRKARSVDAPYKPAAVRAYYLAHALDRARGRVRARARILAHHLGLDTFVGVVVGALEELKIPAIDKGSEAWRAFAEKLKALTSGHWDIGHDWEFTEEEAKILERYLYATQLLVECLDVAYVSDRAAIEERLLRPPRNLPGLLG